MGASQVHPRPLIRYRKPIEDKAFTKWIRTQPCLICGSTYEVEAAHTRQDGQGGLGTKTDDATCIPLCRHCHTDGARAYHSYGNEQEWADWHGLKLHQKKADLRRRYVGADE